jgi:hypothetical protein
MDDQNQKGAAALHIKEEAPNPDHPQHRKVSIGDTGAEHEYLTIGGGDLDITLFIRDGDAIGVSVLVYEKSQ